MESLPFALFIVMLELTIGSFVSLYLLDLRGDSSRGFVIFQGVLYLVFALLTLLAMNAFATPQLVAGRGLDEHWLGAQGPLVLAFALLMLPWNVLLWRDPNSSYRTKKKSTRAGSPPLQGEGMGERWVKIRLARYVVGGAAALVGLAALLDVGMAYRTLADSRLGGAFVLLALVAGALALGGVMTAMLLGHWYLNTPTASGKPLEFVTILMLGALAGELILGLLIGPSTPPHVAQAIVPPAAQTALQTGQHGATIGAPTSPTAQATKAGQQPTSPPTSPVPTLPQQPLDLGAMQAMWVVMGLLAPLGLGGVALHLTRGRSFQSATGMLYLCVVFVFIGEILARGLLVVPIARF
jgi:hypothetical protein